LGFDSNNDLHAAQHKWYATPFLFMMANSFFFKTFFAQTGSIKNFVIYFIILSTYT